MFNKLHSPHSTQRVSSCLGKCGIPAPPGFLPVLHSHCLLNPTLAGLLLTHILKSFPSGRMKLVKSVKRLLRERLVLLFWNCSCSQGFLCWICNRHSCVLLHSVSLVPSSSLSLAPSSLPPSLLPSPFNFLNCGKIYLPKFIVLTVFNTSLRNIEHFHILYNCHYQLSFLIISK